MLGAWLTPALGARLITDWTAKEVLKVNVGAL